MSRHDPLLRLRHIRDAAVAASDLVSGKTEAEFSGSDLLASAVHYKLIIIGEAASTLPESVRSRAADIPWRRIVAMRHVIVHGYDVVDAATVWQTATRRLPELIDAVESLIAEIEAERRQE